MGERRKERGKAEPNNNRDIETFPQVLNNIGAVRIGGEKLQGL